MMENIEMTKAQLLARIIEDSYLAEAVETRQGFKLERIRRSKAEREALNRHMSDGLYDAYRMRNVRSHMSEAYKAIDRAVSSASEMIYEAVKAEDLWDELKEYRKNLRSRYDEDVAAGMGNELDGVIFAPYSN